MAKVTLRLFIVFIACFYVPSLVHGNQDNGYVDYVLGAFKSWIRSNTDDLQAGFIDITQAFDRDPILMLPLNGTIRVFNVTVQGLINIERAGPVISDPEDGTMTFPITVPQIILGSTQITTIGPIMLPVHALIYFKGVKGEMDLTNRTDFGLGPAFSRLEVFDVGRASIQATNWRFLNPVMSIVGAFGARNQTAQFKQFLSFSVPGVMNAVINQIPALQPAP